jgi:hypothetical protein
MGGTRRCEIRDAGDTNKMRERGERNEQRDERDNVSSSRVRANESWSDLSCELRRRYVLTPCAAVEGPKG